MFNYNPATHKYTESSKFRYYDHLLSKSPRYLSNWIQVSLPNCNTKFVRQRLYVSEGDLMNHWISLFASLLITGDCGLYK
jgi:hypothetical protein